MGRRERIPKKHPKWIEIMVVGRRKTACNEKVSGFNEKVMCHNGYPLSVSYNTDYHHSYFIDKGMRQAQKGQITCRKSWDFMRQTHMFF